MRDRLDLKRLPRVGASEGFTQAVLRRARTERNTPRATAPAMALLRARTDRARRSEPRLRLAAAAVAVVVVSAAAGAWWARQAPPADRPSLSAESLDQLRSQYRELDRELQALRRLAHDAQPFVPVAIDPRTEVLFDLRDIEPLPVNHAPAGRRTIR